VPGRAGEPVALDQAVQVVARMPGIEPPRELHGAQRLRQVLQAGALELAPQEAVIEARVVRDEQAAVEPLVELGGERGEARRGGEATRSSQAHSAGYFPRSKPPSAAQWV